MDFFAVLLGLRLCYEPTLGVILKGDPWCPLQLAIVQYQTKHNHEKVDRPFLDEKPRILGVHLHTLKCWYRLLVLALQNDEGNARRTR